MQFNRATLPLCLMLCAAGVAANVRADANLPVSQTNLLAPATDIKIQRGDQTLSFATAREAVAAAQTGDIVLLGPGTHAGPLLLKTSGVTLRGLPGARVNGNSDTWKPTWTKAPEHGPTAYTTPIPWQPVTVAIDQRVMIDAAESRGGLAVHTNGSGRNGREPLESVFTWVASKKQLVVSFARETDPAKHTIEAAKVGDSTIIIRGADNCTVENLILTGGANGVLLQETKGSVVQKCLIYGVDACLQLGPGAENCRLLSNDLTWNQDALHTDADPATADVGSDVWHAHKKYGTYDKFGISVDRAGDNNEIAGNYLYNVWNGITTGDGVGKGQVESYYKNTIFKGISKFNRGLKVHHNRLDLCLDDALEPGGELVNNEWYSNVVTRARCATRMKTISMGPFFYYDNLLLDSMDGLRLYKSMPESATVFIFNNAVQFSSGVIYHEMDSVAWDDPWLKAAIKPGTPGFHIYNNLFLCRAPFAYNAANDKNAPVAPNFKGDYNLYTAPPDARTKAQGIDAHGLFDAKPQLVDEAAGDFHLKAGSAGKAAAQDLGQISLGVALPARLAEAASGHRPDIGLLPPTGEKAPTGPVSGLWAMAESQLNLGERDLTQFTVTPTRWVSGPAIDFVVGSLPASGNVSLQFVRTNATGKGNFKIAITDDTGKSLLSRAGAATERDGFTLDLPAGGARQLRIRIEDDKTAAWQLTSGNGKAGINAAAEVPLRKFDGMPAAFTYTADGKTPSFTVSGKSTYGGMVVEVVRPDGSKESGKSVKIETQGKPGAYQVRISFTKAASIRIEGADDTSLYFNPGGDLITLKPLWGKPKF